MPQIKDVHISAALTNLSIRHSPNTYVADKISPRVPVGKQSDKYYTYDKSNLRIDNTKLGNDKASANQASFSLSDSNYYCEGYALKDLVTDKEIKNADPALNPKTDTTEFLTDKMLIDREYRVASQLMSTSNITQYTTLSGTGQWSDYTSGVSDPIGDIKTGIATIRAATGYKPNTVLMDNDVALTLAAHPYMVDLVKGHTSVAEATILKVLKDLFGLNPLIANSVYNSAKEGQTDSLSSIWGKDVLLAYVSPRVGKKIATLALTFDWGGRVVKTWNNNDPEGTWIKCEEQGLDEKIVGAALGYLVKAAIA